MIEVRRPDSREWLTHARGQTSYGQRMPRRDVGHPRGSGDVRWWEAQVRVALAAYNSSTDGHAQLLSAWLDIRSEMARSERDLGGLADLYLPRGISQELRAVFAQPSNQAQATLLGYREDSGQYVAGMAGLCEREWMALSLWLEPLADQDADGLIVLRLRETREIARDMADERARRLFGRKAWLREETVERYLAEARRKVRSLFRVAA